MFRLLKTLKFLFIVTHFYGNMSDMYFNPTNKDLYIIIIITGAYPTTYVQINIGNAK